MYDENVTTPSYVGVPRHRDDDEEMVTIVVVV